MEIPKRPCCPSLREFSLYVIAKNLDKHLFRGMAEKEIKDVLYLIGPSTNMRDHDIYDLIKMLLKRHDNRYSSQPLARRFDTVLRSNHMFALIHQSLRLLSLVGCGHLVTTQLLGLLAERSMPLQVLELDGLQRRSMSQKSICDLIASCGGTLEQLSLLNSERVGRAVVEAIAEHCPTLQSLSLPGCTELGNEDLLPLCNAPMNSTLFYLDVTGVEVREHSLRALFTSFMELQLLNLHECCVGTSMDGMLITMPGDTSIPNLKFLDLSHSDIKDRDLKLISLWFPNLVHLTLFGCTSLTEDCFESLAELKLLEAISLVSDTMATDAYATWSTWNTCFPAYPTCFQNLSRLTLMHMSTEHSHVQLDICQLAGAVPHLRCLELTNYTLDLTELAENEFTTWLWPALETLTLECVSAIRCCIGPVGALLENLPPSLRRARFRLEDVTMAGLATLTIRWLSSVVALSIVDLRGVMGDAKDLLQKCNGLKELWIQTLPVADDAVSWLCDQFQNVDISVVIVQDDF